MAYSSTSRKQGQRGCCPFPLPPKSPLTQPPLRFGQILLDHSEHFLHNHHASVATLRLLFTFAPECRSASLRNRCSPSPEYPRNTRLVQSGRRGRRCLRLPPTSGRSVLHRRVRRLSQKRGGTNGKVRLLPD